MEIDKKINDVSKEVEFIESRIKDTNKSLKKCREKYQSAARRNDNNSIKKYGRKWDKLESKLEQLRDRKDKIKEKKSNILDEFVSRIKARLTEEQIEELRSELTE